MIISPSGRRARGSGRAFLLSGKRILDFRMAFLLSGRALRDYGRLFCSKKEAARGRLPAFGERSERDGFRVAAGLGPAAGEFPAGGVQALVAAAERSTWLLISNNRQPAESGTAVEVAKSSLRSFKPFPLQGGRVGMGARRR
jgi:hypothetical protein